MINFTKMNKAQLVSILVGDLGYLVIGGEYGEMTISSCELITFNKSKLLSFLEKETYTTEEIMNVIDNHKLTYAIIEEGEETARAWHKNQFPGAFVISYKNVDYAVYTGGSDFYCTTNKDNINSIKG